MVRKLEVFKYFISTNLCLVLFSIVVVGMFYWKNFQITKKKVSILKSNLFYYVIYFSLQIIIILTIVDIILLFTTSNFYFISNPPLTWSYSSWFILSFIINDN
ncbi:hypothetical protein [Spiroplasma mirum]|uniref:hypothetical protein n=1 Tax=Spiroplasma mirum TaxID=2144 RepID=UPI000A5C6C1E|nr:MULTISPECIES: hypothetical protein [Spiroplasma]